MNPTGKPILFVARLPVVNHHWNFRGHDSQTCSQREQAKATRGGYRGNLVLRGTGVLSNETIGDNWKDVGPGG